MEGLASHMRIAGPCRGTNVKSSEATGARVCAEIEGVVQGVGFRPFVYSLARGLGLTGDVRNTSAGVTICIEGDREDIDLFLRKLNTDAPPHARIATMHITEHEPCGSERFEIVESASESRQTRALVLPDLATCDACLAEMRNPDDRRFGYPFINCTHCGPRYSIIRTVPYDRPNTTMDAFRMCPECRAEYEDPADRRFHAQPVACPACGPAIALWDARGRVTARGDAVPAETGRLLEAGNIVAVKGLGGFHLLCDGENRDAVERLRHRKHRSEKPFALMYPSEDLLRRDAFIREQEAVMLRSSEAPIVLLDRSEGARVFDSESAGGGGSGRSSGGTTIGAMLPYTPLHHLLLETFGRPVIATSGNLSEEPLCTDEYEALERLSGIADAFLVHNRPIERAIDDSIVRLIDGKMRVLRRARGFAPLPVFVRSGGERETDARSEPAGGRNRAGAGPVLAVGAHLKSSVAIAGRERNESTHADAPPRNAAPSSTAATHSHDASTRTPVFLSQHLGDLETEASYRAFVRAARALGELFDIKPKVVSCDLHPDYRSSRYAAGTGLPVVTVQHHYAHILAVMAEHGLKGPVLGVSWDGVGLGDDGTIWGGEFLECTRVDYRRVGALTPFRLPGGDQAAREPWRTAFGMLSACGKGTSAAVPGVLRSAVERGINAPLTTSAGRFFDGFASILDICHYNSYEGQAAVMLEQCASRATESRHYGIDIREDRPYREFDWKGLLAAVERDHVAGESVESIAKGVHEALSEGIRSMVSRSRLEDVVLAGGCFQNRLLTEETADRLRSDGRRVWLAETVPPNDGGIALGQAYHVLSRQSARGLEGGGNVSGNSR